MRQISQHTDGKKDGDSKDNVILFPKTVDYYQMMLTRLLEGEQYGEAVELLRFLIRLDSGDPRNRQEWQALLGWLETMQSSIVFTPEKEESWTDEEEELSEQDMLKRHVRQRTSADSGYVSRLLDSLITGSSLEKMLLALGQLTHIEHEEIDPALKTWVQSAQLHPYIRFKGMQALRQRGAEGTLTLNYQGTQMEMDIDNTPLELTDFCPPAVLILQRVEEVSGLADPTLTYFAEQLWNDFLAFIYVSPLYAKLADLDIAGVDVWAAALHSAIHSMMQENPDSEEIKERYGVTDEYSVLWRQAVQAIQTFILMKSPD
ncbi:hypothetical protein [Gorillibacterium massiliense]|uniref:hypothetical protein n=1 Tax=Gorillibacterium massiliense TaxID=1280390 RepID=UPI0012DF1D82|nr:hypothetical protein [Gorillibacterium massiliense]